jgi:hypothetical protein
MKIRSRMHWTGKRKAMRLGLVLSLVSLVVAFAAASSSAAPPTHLKSTFSTDFTAPAGTFCDFNYFNSVTFELNSIVFGDPKNPTRIIVHLTEFVRHINLDTGYTLTEVDHFTDNYDLAGAKQQAKQVGLVWHLRDPSGKLVVVQAGQVLIDFNTGEILKATPNLNPDGAAVICPALGGSPAI